MHRQLLPGLAFAVFVATASLATTARAAVISVTFSGSVTSQTDSGLAVGSPVSGSFSYDTDSASYSAFTVAGRSIAAGYTSEATLTPDNYSAIFQAQLSPVSGASSNQTFTLDLEGVAPWFATAQTDALPVLFAGNLQGNLDRGFSSFSYYVANADGSGIHALTATVDQLAAVPEPSAALLAACGLAGLVLRLRQRRAV